MAAIPSTVVDIAIISIFFHLLFAFRDRLRRRGVPYPPGPKPWPIIGNLLDSPKESQWTAYTEMSKEYGLCDVIARSCAPFTETSFHIARRRSVPPSFWAGYRSAQFSVRCQRPTREARGNLLGSSYFADASYVSKIPAIHPCCRLWMSLPTDCHLVLCRMEVDWLLPVTEYGERWREGRKIAERSLRPGAMSSYHQRIEEKTRAFLGELLASPADFRRHIKLSVVLFSTGVAR